MLHHNKLRGDLSRKVLFQANFTDDVITQLTCGVRNRNLSCHDTFGYRLWLYVNGCSRTGLSVNSSIVFDHPSYIRMLSKFKICNVFCGRITLEQYLAKLPMVYPRNYKHNCRFVAKLCFSIIIHKMPVDIRDQCQ